MVDPRPIDSAAPEKPKLPDSDPERRAWVFGFLMGIVLTVVMLQVWWRWPFWAAVWFCVLMVIGPFLPRKRPAAKMIMIALFMGTLLAGFLADGLNWLQLAR